MKCVVEPTTNLAVIFRPRSPLFRSPEKSLSSLINARHRQTKSVVGLNWPTPTLGQHHHDQKLRRLGSQSTRSASETPSGAGLFAASNPLQPNHDPPPSAAPPSPGEKNFILDEERITLFLPHVQTCRHLQGKVLAIERVREKPQKLLPDKISLSNRSQRHGPCVRTGRGRGPGDARPDSFSIRGR